MLKGWSIEDASASKEYGGDVFAKVERERRGSTFAWTAYKRLYGGRLDGTNYFMGQFAIREGFADTIDDAMRACDAAMAERGV